MFNENMEPDRIRSKVQRRVSEYAGDRDAWSTDWFEPTLDRIAPELTSMSWEEIIQTILDNDSTAGANIQGFYDLCLRFNGPRANEEVAG